MIANVNTEIINENLKECWSWYTDYLGQFTLTHYSDQKPMDFVEYCENELYQCPNCGQIVAIDEQFYDNEPFNCDNVCDDCIRELGYYE